MKNYFFIFASLTVLFYGTLLYFSEDTKSSIKLGQSLAMSGPLSKVGMQYHYGAKAYFDEINQKGGVKGRIIELVVMDDKYEPVLAQKNIEILIKEKNVFAIFGMVGTPTTQSVLNFILKNNTPFLMPFTGAVFLYKNHPLIINLRASYSDEAQEIMNHVQLQGIKRVAIFYQNDSYGICGLAAFKSATRERGIEIVSEGVYNRNTLAIESALNDILSSGAEAVLMAGAYKPSLFFVNKASSINKNLAFYSLSFVGSDILSDDLDASLDKFYIAQPIPKALHVSLHYEEFLRVFKSRYPEQTPTNVAFEGYIAAKLFSYALSNAKKIERRALISSFENLSKLRLEGVETKVSMKNHKIFDEVSLIRFKNGTFEYVK